MGGTLLHVAEWLEREASGLLSDGVHALCFEANACTMLFPVWVLDRPSRFETLRRIAIG